MQNRYKVCSERSASGGKWPMANGQFRCKAADQSPDAIAAGGRGWYEIYDNSTNSTNSHFERKAEEGWRSTGCTKSLTHSLPLARPSRACGFAQWSSRSCQVFPIIEIVAVATCKPFAGGLLHSRSVGLMAFACGESFSQLPKLLKSQAAQVDNLTNLHEKFSREEVG